MTLQFTPSLSHDRGVAHRFLAGRELLEGVRHHEVPELAVVVEVLHFRLDDVGRLDRIARAEVRSMTSAGLEVADADPVERLALARLDELVLDDRVGIPSSMILSPERNSLVL